MVSGAIGGFLDVAFNFNTQALLDDNLLGLLLQSFFYFLIGHLNVLFLVHYYVAGQFFSIGWKMVMLGDETWLKLFPGLFTRHDGVSSFYVSLSHYQYACIFILVIYLCDFLDFIFLTSRVHGALYC